MFSLSLLFAFVCPIQAQIKLSEDFVQILDQAGIEWMEPVEARYKQVPVRKKAFQAYDYAIRSRKERIEIRYIIRPYEPGAPSADVPHVEASRLVMHLATNDEDYLIAGREVAPELLSGFFNADWGMQYFFHPKAGFADWNHCEVLALHKDGQGTAFVLFLFDEPSRELGNRFYALRFKAYRLGAKGGAGAARAKPKIRRSQLTGYFRDS